MATAMKIEMAIKVDIFTSYEYENDDSNIMSWIILVYQIFRIL